MLSSRYDVLGGDIVHEILEMSHLATRTEEVSTLGSNKYFNSSDNSSQEQLLRMENDGFIQGFLLIIFML